MIPRDTIERIYSAARIEDVVGDYVSLKRRGANLIGLCPFHDEKTGSFTVSPAKGIYKCFGCGKSGQTVSFIMEIEQCSYVEALRLLAKKYHIEIEERELTDEERQSQDDRESMFIINDFACQWFEQQLWETDEGKAVGLSYLRQRGLRDDIIRRFHIGYSPDKNLFSQAAKQKGYSEKYLINDSQNPPYVGTGLCIKTEDGRMYDRFHSRVIFPFYSRSGKVVGFAGRIMKSNDKVGKYVNSPTSPLFEKHNELYGLLQAKQHISRLNSCYLVEGQMDVISMHQAGIENVVSSGGTSLTKPQIQLIHRFTSNITILYDGDKAGIKAALRGIDMVLEEGINVKIVQLPEGEDPDSYARSHNASEVAEYIKKHESDFINFKTHLLSEDTGNDPLKRSELIRSVVSSIAAIPDAITRQIYTKDCAEQLNTSEEVLAREIASTRNKKKSDNITKRTYENQSLQNQDSAIKTDIQEISVFNHNMQNLIQLIIRYGERVIYEGENGDNIQCGWYIISCLKEDNIEPRIPIHSLIISEYLNHYKDPGFKSEDYFLHCDNNDITTLATTLITDPYPLSRIYSHQSISENVVQDVNPTTDADILPDITQQMLMEIKYTVINERLDTLQHQLKKAQADNDWEQIRVLLLQQPQLQAIRSQIAQLLGNRVIQP